MKKESSLLRYVKKNPLLILGFTLVVIIIILIKNRDYPEYKGSNQAVSYVWHFVGGTQKIVIDSTSYIYVSAIFNKEAKTKTLKILKFVNQNQKEELLLTETKENHWIENPTKKEEEMIKFVFQKVKRKY